MIWSGFYDFRPGNAAGPILTALEPALLNFWMFICHFAHLWDIIFNQCCTVEQSSHCGTSQQWYIQSEPFQLQLLSYVSDYGNFSFNLENLVQGDDNDKYKQWIQDECMMMPLLNNLIYVVMSPRFLESNKITLLQVKSNKSNQINP